MTFPVTLTTAASEKAYELLQREGREDMSLRIKVDPGGCSGLIYKIFFESESYDGDSTENFGELEVVVDKMSVPYLDGAIVDFVDTLEKQGFQIDNPNAGGSCACGDSFH